jgi:predicted GNAT family N-acyltransferase
LSSKPSEFPFKIEPLSEHHDKTGFSSGVDALDSYLLRQAGQDTRKYAAVTFIATPDGTTIAGYYTLSQYAVHLDVVPPFLAKGLPRYPMVPATLLGRLAVSSSFRGQRVGSALLVNALKRSLELSRQIASAGVVVDAKDESAASFYKKYGFIELPTVQRRLFLPMKTIEMFFR